MRGGMEAIYDDVPVPVGLTHFASRKPARGAISQLESWPASLEKLRLRLPFRTTS